nr:uncharacterized protein LOC117610911 isoform X1 [Osmia lignaria]
MESSPGKIIKRKYKEESSKEEEAGNSTDSAKVGNMAEPMTDKNARGLDQWKRGREDKEVSNATVGSKSNVKDLKTKTKGENNGKDVKKDTKANKVRIIESTEIKQKYKIIDDIGKNKETENKEHGLGKSTDKEEISENKVREHAYYKTKEESEALYVAELESGEYTICVSLNKEKLSNKRKYNLVKIYNIINILGAKIREIRMMAFSRTEITLGTRREANRIIEYGRKKEAGYEAYIPRRKRTRRGVTKEWEDTLEELKNCVMTGQGDFEAQRLKRRRLRGGKAVWEDSDAVLLTFKGDSLPTRLYIGQGHVWLKIEPFIESVKQCFRCFRYGHLQAVCKSRFRRYKMCSEEFHADCKKEQKCVNCGEAHRSNARECLIFQRESEIKKTMAYKNVSYSQAREILRDKYTGRRFDLDIESEKDFPKLRTEQRGKSDKWERLNVPERNRGQNVWNRDTGYRRNQERVSSDESEG